MNWRDTWNNFKARFKDSRPLSERANDAMQAEEEEKEPEKTAEKTWEPLVWTKRVEDWKEMAVCVHCDHSTSDLHGCLVCPKCGCKGSHEVKVVRWEWEETCCSRYHPEFDAKLINYGGYGYCILLRNKKLVTWTGCSANEGTK